MDKGVANEPVAASLFEFVLKAVQLGFMGFGAVVLVLSFIIIFTNKPPASENNAKLRQNFLVFGFASFLFAGLVTLYSTYQASHHELTVTISPDFSVAGLSPPNMKLSPQGTHLGEGQAITIDRDTTLHVRVDKAISEVKKLNEVAVNVTTETQRLSAELAEDRRAPTQVRANAAEVSGQTRLVLEALGKNDMFTAARRTTELRDVGTNSPPAKN
jgi:hypothetical protein